MLYIRNMLLYTSVKGGDRFLEALDHTSSFSRTLPFIT